MRTGSGGKDDECGAEWVWKLADAEGSGCGYFEILLGLIEIILYSRPHEPIST
jgi:hypothetical protein